MEIFKDKKQWLIVFGILFAVGFLSYSNSFHGEFHLDDRSSIADNPAVRAGTFARLWEYAKTRFVPHLTFSLDYKFHGEDVFGYHVVNFMIHLLAAFAVYFFSMFLLQTPRISDPARKIPDHLIALFAALLFLCHPAQTQAVSYIVQRIASLAALFYICSAVFYLRSRLTGDRVAYLFSLVFCGLAFISKENAFTLPFAILLLEWIGWGFSKKDLLKQIARTAPFFLIATTFPDFFIFRILCHDRAAWLPGILDREELTISRTDYLFTQFRVICTYLRLLVLPVNQMVDYDYPVYHSFLAPSVLAGFAFLSAVFISGLLLLKKERLLAFGIFWFFLTISIESSILPIKDVIFEHRMYLPMAGATLFFSYGIYKLCGNSKAFLIAASILVLVLSAMTFSRNSVWQTETSLWTDNLKKAPRNARAYLNLGNAYSDKNQLKKGFDYYNKAIEIDPNYAEAYLNLGVYYRDAGDQIKEEACYKEAIEKNPRFILAYYNLGTLYVGQGKREEAVAMFEQALKIAPNLVPALNSLALVYFNEGNTDKAAEYWKDTIQKDPSFISAQQNLGILYSQQKKWDLAAKQFEEVLKYDPGFGEAAYNLGVAYFKLKRIEDAELQLAVLKQLQKKDLASRLENILQGKISGKRKLISKDFVKCDSWDDECFGQYEEELRDAQRDVAANQETREIIELNKFVRSIKKR